MKATVLDMALGKTAALLLLTTSFAVSSGAQEKKKTAPTESVPDGIYLVHEKGTGPKVTRNDTGQQLHLGERLTTQFGKATIHATNNANSRFDVYLAGAGPLPQAQLSPHMAILIGGRCFMIYSHSDTQPNGTVNLSTVIHGEEAMPPVAKALKVTLLLRKHPGHKFAVTFVPDKASYRPGEAITLKMTIKNVDGNTVCFFDGGQQRGPRDNQFGFIAMRGHGAGKAVPDTGDPTNFGGIGSYRTLKPGDVFTKDVRLDKWFQFKDADTYLITATYRMAIYDAAGQKLHRALWEDFATAQCTVRIEKAK